MGDINSFSPLRSNTPGFENIPSKATKSNAKSEKVNLFDKAVELAGDGNLNPEDLLKLENIAKSDDNLQGSEALLLETLTAMGYNPESAEAKSFFNQAVEARQKKQFNPGQDIEIPSNGKLFIPGPPLPSGESSYFNLSFSSERIHGGDRASQTCNQTDFGEAARKNLQELILKSSPKGGLAAWGKVQPKHDLEQVQKFIQGRNFSPTEKMAFLQSYLQGHYDHTGVGADGGGVKDIQQILPHLPQDAGKRKFIECEAFTAITQKLFPDAKLYVVKATADPPEPGQGPGRNHTVSVLHFGDQRFVQNNDVVQEITTQQFPPKSPAVQTLTDQELIEAFKSPKGNQTLFRPVFDPTPLTDGAELYDVGETISLDPPYILLDGKVSDMGRSSLSVVVTGKIDDLHLRVARANNPALTYVLRFAPGETPSKILLPDP